MIPAMKRSMLRTAAGLLAAQLLIYGVVGAAYGFSWTNLVVFLLVCLPYHGLILFGMLKLAHLFALAKNGKPLERVNIANHLSLFRLSSVPTLAFLITAMQRSPVFVVTVVFIAAVFITDLLDGKLARRLNQVTFIGQYLDSASDYVILFATSVVFIVYGLITVTFLVLLILRLLVVAGGNTLIYAVSGDAEPRTSYLGKASVFAVMGFFAFRLLQFILEAAALQSPGLTFFYGVVDRMGYMTEGVLVVSLFEKTGLFLKTWSQTRSRPGE